MMGFTVQQLGNEPIVLVIFPLPIHEYLDELTEIHTQLATIAEQCNRTIYHIPYSKQIVDLSYSDILLWISESRESAPGSIADPRVHLVLVGTTPMLHLAVKKFREQFEIDVPIFPCLEHAIEYARRQIAAQHLPMM
ncbi:MAG TPA: hypothetical protein VHP83_09320 [Aggregatilineaceae bacterium]|nr:hypothetical protein [Aggregatilineaceae bacterium]